MNYFIFIKNYIQLIILEAKIQKRCDENRIEDGQDHFQATNQDVS